MTDLMRDWNQWSNAERTAATLLLSTIVALPAFLLLAAI
jgi:hypothetical protein